MSTTIQFEASGYVFTTWGELETTTCGVCGVPFAAPVELLAWSRKKPHRSFYCPAGHSLHFPGKSEAQRLRESQEALAAERAEHDQTQAQLRAQRAQTTRARNERDRLKTRAKHGVCPCCNRTFKQLAAHMKNKHPEYAEENAA